MPTPYRARHARRRSLHLSVLSRSLLLTGAAGVVAVPTVATALSAPSLSRPADAAEVPFDVHARLAAQHEELRADVATQMAVVVQERSTAEVAQQQVELAAARAAAEQAAAERADRDRRAAEAARAAAAQDPRSIARQLLAARGQSGQFSCLDSLWTKESGWKVSADNPTSSAYGIPQALPGNKMANAGSDWRTNPRTQISWGLSYIADAYGTPCAAWSHSKSHNWY